MLLRKSFAFIVILFSLVSCSKYSKMEKRVQTLNDINLAAGLGFFMHERDEEYWVKMFSDYCNDEGWNENECRKEVIAFRTEYRKSKGL